MALQSGTRLGPYEIGSAIGAGGMGEVYRAHDTKLHRDVAIKVLPEAVAHDTERLARFEREARTLASLNHPNIAQIHGLEESDGTKALVMELVEGPTLADRIAQGPIPIDEALSIARQIAEGLEAAHEQGIIHRDLKPANVKVRPDGVVKVLDFGLAKALEPMSVRGIDATASPTITSPAMMTGMGVILGTAAYMSPEQAKGRTADKRSDMWAFGCVLYEMLTGKRAIAGEDVSETLAAVLKSDPSWSALPPDLPPAIRRLLRRCLTKDSKGRIGDASIARIEIDEVQRGPSVDGEMAQKTPRRRERLAWTVAALALVTLAVFAVVWALHPVPTAPEMRVEINTPPTTDPWSLAISPDGQKLVFVASSEGRSLLWLRPLDSISARPLAGTDRAFLPFWSPDSRSVGFFADSQLRRIDIDDGSVQAVATVGLGGLGGAWNRDGVILFSSGPTSPIFRVPATGGEPAAVTRLEKPQQQHHYSPEFLPDGRHFLYYVLGSPEARGVYIGQLDGSPARRLLDADAPAVYASSGHLLFVRQGRLFAQHFDPGRLELTRNQFPVAERVTVGYGPLVAAVSASAAGPLVYRSGSVGGQQLVWVDRAGEEIGKVGGPDSFSPSISRDDRRVAVFDVDGNVDVWLLDPGRSVARVSRFTTDAADDVKPIWSPDGTSIVFSSNRKGVFDLYQKSASGAGNEDLLLATAQTKFATDWSLDGRFLLYHSRDPKMSNDIWALPRDGDRKPFPVVQTNFDEGDAQFSPDGKWIAYQSNETGRFEIYVQPFPGPGGKSLISTTGGYQARWRREGKELFYIGQDNRLMAVPIQFGQTVEPGAPVPLFRIRISGPIENDRWYVVSLDGQRFLVSTFREEAIPITAILNWKPKF